MLQVRNIVKSYEGKPLLSGLSFDLSPGEIICLLGASGSGKSTLLRIITGLEEAESGEVYWNEQDLSSVPAHKRGFGLMFQDYTLFPHKTVYENIAFGLRMQKRPANEIEAIVSERLKSIRMQDFAKRPVTELSGGEQQRVALARALAPDPRLLMLDEPLGALDHNLRDQLTNELRQMLRESHKPVIYVTHDRQEAFGLADRLLILHDGLILQEGSPQALFERPANAWVAQFLGLGNLIPSESMAAFKPSNDGPLSQFSYLLRPKDARILQAGDTAPFQFEGDILDCVYIGDGYQAKLKTKHGVLLFETPQPCSLNEKKLIFWPEEKVKCLKN